MTHAMKSVPRLAAACPAPRAGIPAALIGALLLAGCSTGHIGDSWQCPLAEGGSCDSVAAADPAVPDPEAAGGTVLSEPLWRVRATEAAAPCAADCDGGFAPFAWLERLFGGDGDRGAAGQPEPANMEGGTPPDGGGREADEAKSPPAAASAESRHREPVPAALAAAAFPAEPDRAQDGPHAGDLRTGEIVARIWIAPFVDADGVYREASHVRVVLEPAGWRLK